MTVDPSTLVAAAGVLALVAATLKILAVRIVMRRPPLPNVPIPRESVLRLSLQDIFIPMLFGILSLGFRSPRCHVALCFALGKACGALTNRWSGRVRDKVPIPYVGVRAALLNR